MPFACRASPCPAWQAFYELTTLLMALADECCDGRVVSVLEGGYKPDDLAQCCAMHVRALAGAPAHHSRRGFGGVGASPAPPDDEAEGAGRSKRAKTS